MQLYLWGRMKSIGYHSETMYLLTLVFISITNSLCQCMITITQTRPQTMIFLEEQLLFLLHFLEISICSMVDLLMAVTRRKDMEKFIL